MSNAEAPDVHVEDIVDKEGVPIVNSAEFDVSMQKSLAKEQHVAGLEATALRAGGEAKLREAEAVAQPDEASGQAFVDSYQKREGALQDAEILLGSSATAEETAFQARQGLKRNEETSASHVDENLPEYVQTATSLANTALSSRVGQKVAVTGKQDGLVGFTEAKLVDPATQNQDIAPPTAVAGPEAGQSAE